MRIMVFDVAAESGGALSILKDFYEIYKKDLKNEYIFIISKPKLLESANIKIIQFPWVKRSWFHRLYFDYFIAPKLVKEYLIERVISLQNIIIPFINVFQTVFIHNALPFSENKFSFFKNKPLWVYQKIISKFIFRSIEKADKVIVQTKWLKETIINKLNICDDKIEINQPKIEINIIRKYHNSNSNITTFFYPANEFVYKNHRIIVDACIQLKKCGIDNYNVIFTLRGKENKNIARLYRDTTKYGLPIKYIGSIERETVYNYYSKSILIFPSSIETFGLPLLEAKMHGSPIIVYEQPFSKEILNNYNNAYFVTKLESNAFFKAMLKYIME